MEIYPGGTLFPNSILYSVTWDSLLQTLSHRPC